jgi:purine-binding chemotaxis protein CheW
MKGGDILNKVDKNENQVLSFIVGPDEYAVDILSVQEIKGWERTTKIPNTKDFVMGAINLRGAVVPIIDLRLMFGFGEAAYDQTTVVIVINTEDKSGSERVVGIVVDAVSDVHSLVQDIVQDSPGSKGRVSSDIVKGLATVKEDMVVVLDVQELIAKSLADSVC